MLKVTVWKRKTKDGSLQLNHVDDKNEWVEIEKPAPIFPSQDHWLTQNNWVRIYAWQKPGENNCPVVVYENEQD